MQWLGAKEAGLPEWWWRIALVGAPIVEDYDKDRVKISWLWRDPKGNEQRSSICRVYIDINGVTDHHSTSPCSLERIPGTDIWHWSTVIARDWRGSYSLIPVRKKHLPPFFSADELQCKQQQRAWWISLFPLAISDPLNPLPACSTRSGYPLSVAQGPGAADQSAWLNHSCSLVPERLSHFTWHSNQLGNQRRIWVYATGKTEVEAERPLVILLDGQNWIEGHPLLPVLERETAAGSLPAACWLFIDAIDSEHRGQELPCNAAFWQTIKTDLLPLVKQQTPFSDVGSRTVVAGQSYGGLAAMYAGLHWPERFGCVLSQSGSFWWPDTRFVTDFNLRHGLDEGWLIRQVRQGNAVSPMLTVYQEAGDREIDIEFVNQQMYQALKAAGHHVNYRIFSGGHDAFCWRDGLLEGLRWLFDAMNNPHTLTDR